MKTQSIDPTWVKDVGGLKCVHSNSIRNGHTRYGRQRFLCKECGRAYIKEYTNKAYDKEINVRITEFLKEGVGSRSTSRLLGISKTTISKRILYIASLIKKPVIGSGQIYEIDELQTYIGHKGNRNWIAYAMERDTKQVVDFNICKRNNRMFKPIIGTVLHSDAKRIITDRLINYRYLVPEVLHSTKLYGINHIERNGNGPKMLVGLKQCS